MGTKGKERGETGRDRATFSENGREGGRDVSSRSRLEGLENEQKFSLLQIDATPMGHVHCERQDVWTWRDVNFSSISRNLNLNDLTLDRRQRKNIPHLHCVAAGKHGRARARGRPRLLAVPLIRCLLKRETKRERSEQRSLIRPSIHPDIPDMSCPSTIPPKVTTNSEGTFRLSRGSRQLACSSLLKCQSQKE